MTPSLPCVVCPPPMPSAAAETPSKTNSGAAPERSLHQRMDALKRDLRAGKANINVLLLSPPDYIATAKVSDMLLAVPKYGQVKVNKILQQCRISPSKTIGGLSQRQRAELVSHFRK